MLMTAVMRKHPHFGLTQLLLAFFDQFAQYDWSIPVTLVPTERHPEMECDQMVWEENHSRETPVVILTPCFPASNASRNVTFSARQLIATELNRGLLVLQSALRGETEIEEIFTRVDFASSFSYFIEVTMESVSATQLAEWTGWCESKWVLVAFPQQTARADFLHREPDAAASDRRRRWAERTADGDALRGDDASECDDGADRAEPGDERVRGHSAIVGQGAV